MKENTHGGEVHGQEALLMLLPEIATGEHADWMDHLVLRIPVD